MFFSSNRGSVVISRFATAPALVAMLLHSALGCCWHHEHIEIGLAEVAAAEGGGTCGHAHAPGSDDEHSSVPEHEHLPCDQGHCVSVLAKDVRVSECLQLVATLDSLGQQPLDSLLGQTIDSQRHLEDPPPDESRQHRALLQVWLI